MRRDQITNERLEQIIAPIGDAIGELPLAGPNALEIGLAYAEATHAAEYHKNKLDEMKAALFLNIAEVAVAEGRKVPSIDDRNAEVLGDPGVQAQTRMLESANANMRRLQAAMKALDHHNSARVQISAHDRRAMGLD